MACTLRRSSLLQRLVMTLIAVVAPVAKAGYLTPKFFVDFAKSTPSFASGVLGKVSASVDNTKMLLEDDWVDTQITRSAPSLCRSLRECGLNTTSPGSNVLSYEDVFNVFSSKRALLSVLTPVESNSASTETAPEAVQSTVAVRSDTQGRLALEMHAVRLSLLVEKSCTQSAGPRQCWRSGTQSSSQSDKAVKELRPMTVTFSELHSSQAAPKDPVPTQIQTSLVSSLRQFVLTSA